MTIKNFISTAIVALSPVTCLAVPVEVTMNSVSPTMKLFTSDGETPFETGEPSESKVYSFDISAGKYLLQAFATDGETLNGTIELIVEETNELNEFKVFTITAYATNSEWEYDKDYTISVSVNSKDGNPADITVGNSVTEGRKTFLALSGNSYNVAYIPSTSRMEEGYMTGYKVGTITANVTASFSIPTGGEFEISAPEDARLTLGMKFTHFTDFTPIEPISVLKNGDQNIYKYRLAHGQTYNYRTWKDGGLTHAGYFSMNQDETRHPVIEFSHADYYKHDPKEFNHDVESNSGYETGDIFVNINPSGFLKLKEGESFIAHAMRCWELTDNSVNNYFFEPDFHYTVINLDGTPSSDIIEIEENPGSAWATIKAKNRGTAIVLVTYDGINVNYYSGAEKKEYLGGEYWGAIWPENTAAYVVSVGQDECAAIPNMLINETYNEEAKKMAGKFVDAEHDIFYYLESEEGFVYSFIPENVSNVEIAYPLIGEKSVSYSGFAKDGVTKNEDGSYSVLLKHGRQIVRLTDENGASTYQILTAKPCRREITNMSRPGSLKFQPGDDLFIQYYGLRHPANKLAGIYNMSAYITYNGIPNGSSVILGSGQYTFASSQKAQQITVTIPSDLDVTQDPYFKMTDGVIQVNGFGDPIGNHRYTSYIAGRSPNFTAVAHKTYFGSLPDVAIPLSPVYYFDIQLIGDLDDAEINILYNGEPIEISENGTISGTYGSYDITANKPGHRLWHYSFTLGEGDDQNQIIPVDLIAYTDWDGKELQEPATDTTGVYQISSPSELAWFANKVNTEKKCSAKASLLNDIDLGDYNWTPIGNNSSSYYFAGEFNGNGHTIKGLYVKGGELAGLFGYLQGTETDYVKISGITVEGTVHGEKNSGGIASAAYKYVEIEKCANYADISSSHASAAYAAGILAYPYYNSVSIKNSYNAGTISGGKYQGGITAYVPSTGLEVENVFNIGRINDNGNANACFCFAKEDFMVETAYAIEDYSNQYGYKRVTEEQMESGEIAYLLGEAFKQTIGIQPYPEFDGLVVYYDANEDNYFNYATSFKINLGEGDENVSIEDSEIIIPTDETYQIGLTAEPVPARLPQVLWSSSDTNVVEVEATGSDEATITAKAYGRATITVKFIENPEINDSCEVIVTMPSEVMSLLGNNVDTATVFDFSGRVIMHNAHLSLLKNLNPGLYIIKSGNKEYKILIK